MIEEKYDFKTYVETEKVLASEKRYCDVCGKEITGSHWGIRSGDYNLSLDNLNFNKNMDACSEECLKTMFEEYIFRSCNSDNTYFFEIYHNNTSSVKGDTNYD